MGSRNGDIIACVSHHKTSAENLPAPVSVELDREYCDKMRDRNVAVVCDSITDLDETTLPVSDYYFWWPMAAATQNAEWLRHIGGVLRRKGVAKGKTAIIACDMSWAEDVESSYNIRDHFNGVWKGKVWYDEGEHDRMFGAFRLIHVDLDQDFPTEEEIRAEKDRQEEERRRHDEQQRMGFGRRLLRRAALEREGTGERLTTN